VAWRYEKEIQEARAKPQQLKTPNPKPSLSILKSLNHSISNNTLAFKEKEEEFKMGI